MGTEVLRPHDLLAERFNVSPAPFHRRRRFTGTDNLKNLVRNGKTRYNTGYKKDSQQNEKTKSNPVTKGKRSSSYESRRKDDALLGGPVMEQVTILRRGESLDSLTSAVNHVKAKPNAIHRMPLDDLAVCGAAKLPRQVHILPPADGYAGSAFFSSPSPGSVPLPSFFVKSQDDSNMKTVHDSATRDLRRLLRLE